MVYFAILIVRFVCLVLTRSNYLLFKYMFVISRFRTVIFVVLYIIVVSTRVNCWVSVLARKLLLWHIRVIFISNPISHHYFWNMLGKLTEDCKVMASKAHICNHTTLSSTEQQNQLLCSTWSLQLLDIGLCIVRLLDDIYFLRQSINMWKEVFYYNQIINLYLQILADKFMYKEPKESSESHPITSKPV